MSTKLCYIICGLPGTGKSTLAEKLAPAYNIATDDYPGLYVDGVYQAKLQKESHQWCLDTFKKWILAGHALIAVHNTFMLDKYRQPYTDFANQHGYIVSVINMLSTYIDGQLTQSVHNVPLDVIENMSRTFEPVISYPELGLNLADLDLNSLIIPDAFLLDMDGTIKTTRTKLDFPVTPDDFELTEEYLASLDFLKTKPKYILSNQHGIKFGRKTLDFLKEEYALLKQELKNHGDYLTGACFAVDDKTLYYDYGKHLHGQHLTENPVKKPEIGMLRHLLERTKLLNNTKQIWYIGDMHTNKHPSDYQFALKAKQILPQLKYVPIELLPYLAKTLTNRR